jgi:L-asparagine oxygenase
LGQPEEFVVTAQIEAGRLSEALRRSLIVFRRFGDTSGALLVRGVPTGIVPPTPGRTGAAVGTHVAAAAMSVLLASLGDQYGFRPELGGSIVQDILPMRVFEAQEISVGSSVPLSFHVEMAFSPFRSDYVALLCLRGDHEQQAATMLSSIDTVLPLLDPATVEVLEAPRFRTRVDRSFLLAEDRTDDVWIDPICVFNDPRSRPQLRVDFAETQGKDPPAERALDALRGAMLETQAAVYLGPGDLIIVDNNRAVHGRSSFAPRYDGNDRWLLRSFVTKDLRRSERVRPGDTRIVEPDYPSDTTAET